MECEWASGAGARAGGQPGMGAPRFDGVRMWTGGGCPVISLPGEFTFLRPLYSSSELAFDGIPWTLWARQKWYDGTIPVLCILYLLATFAGQFAMASRKAYDLRGALGVWNRALALFSLLGALRTLPHLLYLIASRGFHASMCLPAETASGMSACGLYVAAFCFSKVPELFDTAFIVARKKHLSFLHYFHHATVLAYTWFSYGDRTSTGLYFGSVNFLVHAIMYDYYARQAGGGRPTWGAWITALQIAQMFLGLGIVSSAVYFKLRGDECDVTDANLVAASVMYLSYLLLFARFAVQRYCTRAARGDKDA
jgi:elongation of very long chain fatty acids protein 6